MQERIAKRVFQPSDLLAHGGLRSMNPLARAGEAARIDDSNEASEKIKVEHGAIHISTENDFII
jgi:hypothetical protein